MTVAVVLGSCAIVASFVLGYVHRAAVWHRARALCAEKGPSARGPTEQVNLAILRVSRIPQIKWMYSAYRGNARLAILKDEAMEKIEARREANADFGSRADVEIGPQHLVSSELAAKVATENGSLSQKQLHLVEAMARENEVRESVPPPKAPWTEYKEILGSGSPKRAYTDLHHRFAVKLQRIARGYLARRGVRVAETLQLMDCRLDRSAVRALATFLLFLAAASAAALVLILVGVMHASANSKLVPHKPVAIDNTYDAVVAHEFTPDVKDWAQFTRECCCSEGGERGDAITTEVWTCANGYSKIRNRVEKVFHNKISMWLAFACLFGTVFLRMIPV